MTTKKLFLISLLTICTTFTLHSQSKKEIIVGKHYLTHQDIKATVHEFPERIHEYYLDTTTNYLTLQLRGTNKKGKWLKNTGEVLVYDLTNHQKKWSKKINYQNESIEQVNNTIIFSKMKSACLDPETGEEKWKTKSTVYYTDPLYNIGLGYRTNSQDLLQGIDLNNGETIWNRRVDRDYGWNNLNFLNDSTILIAATGLHTINFIDGSGWDYDSNTGKRDYTATIVANALGIVGGLLTGAFVITTGHDRIRGLVSNTLIEDDNIYFADAKQISCLDFNGDTKWVFSFDKKIASNSIIFIEGDILYMLNLGYAFMGNRKLNYGIPFIAAYDKNTGENLFMTIAGKKDSPINDDLLKENTILLLFDDKIAEYSLIDGSVVSLKNHPKDFPGEKTMFLGTANYIKSDSSYISLVASNPDKTYLFHSEKIFVLDDQFDIEEEMGFDTIYHYYFSTDNYLFLTKGEETFILDKSFKEVAKIEVSRHSFVAGNKLYEIRDNTITEIDISDFR